MKHFLPFPRRISNTEERQNIWGPYIYLYTEIFSAKYFPLKYENIFAMFTTYVCEYFHKVLFNGRKSLLKFGKTKPCKYNLSWTKCTWKHVEYVPEIKYHYKKCIIFYKYAIKKVSIYYYSFFSFLWMTQMAPHVIFREKTKISVNNTGGAIGIYYLQTLYITS